MCLKLVVDDATKKCFDLISSSTEFTLSAVIFHRVWSLLRNFYRITHTHIRLTALCPGLPRWASSRKVKPIWILLKQETVSGSGISWAVCKSAPRSRQTTTPAPHYSVFLQAGCPSCCPTNSVKALKARIYWITILHITSTTIFWVLVWLAFPKLSQVVWVHQKRTFSNYLRSGLVWND